MWAAKFQLGFIIVTCMLFVSDFVKSRFPFITQAAFGSAVNNCTGKNVDKERPREVCFKFQVLVINYLYISLIQFALYSCVMKVRARTIWSCERI